MFEIKVEKNVPMVGTRAGKVRKEVQAVIDTFDSMEIGDSFAIPEMPGNEKDINNLFSAVRRVIKGCDYTIVIKTTPTGQRAWKAMVPTKSNIEAAKAVIEAPVADPQVGDGTTATVVMDPVAETTSATKVPVFKTTTDSPF